MELITSATENRINKLVKNDNRYGEVLAYLLETMKCNIGCSGATIKEMKTFGESLKNYNQFDVYLMPILFGMSINFPEYINTVGTHDLHYVTIRDFNKLVKECENE